MRLAASLALAKRLYRNRDGAIAVLLALTIPALVGMVALSVEAGTWYVHKRNLQTAADAAAIGAAYDLAYNNGANLNSAASSEASRNGWSAANGSVSVTQPASNEVQVSLTMSASTLLSQMFLETNSVTVGASAGAEVVTDPDFCILALHPSASDALQIWGSADLNLAGCGIAVNSNNATAFTMGGNGALTGKSVHVVGGADTGGSSAVALQQGMTTNGRAVTDPYAGVDMPSYSGCDETDTWVKSNKSRTIDPGADGIFVMCDGLRVQGDLTLSPGVYVVDGGDIDIQGSLTGTDVTIVLTDDAGEIRVNANSTMSLQAPTSGTYAGIAFYQDRAASTGAYTHLFNGGASMEIEGVLYFPTQYLEFKGGASASGGCTQIVASKIKFTGNNDIDSDCTGTGTSDISLPTVRLKV